MLRALAALCVLMLSVSAVAGCGGASLQEIALREAKLHVVGGHHQRVIRVESVRDTGGANLAVAIVQGDFTLPPAGNPSCGLGGTTCRPPRPQHVHYYMVAFSPRHPDSWSAGPTSAAELGAVAQARKARALFSIFPDFASFSVRCAIPRGGSHPGTIPGLCHTTYQTLNHTRVVEFGEKWPLASLSPSGYGPHETSARWIVTLGRSGHVQSIQVTGHHPPQLWK